MRKRLVMTLVVGAVVGGWALVLFEAPWYNATWEDITVPLELMDFDGSDIIPHLVCALVTMYFFLRLMATGILVLLGGPTSTKKIAWHTPFGAQLQAGLASVAAIVMNAIVPSIHLMFFGKPFVTERSYGGPLLLVCCVFAHVVIHLIARDPELAATQTWPIEETYRRKTRHRWIRSAPQERPMLAKPPLPPVVAVDPDPFRSPAPSGLAAQMVVPETNASAPRKDSDDAPAPKLLV